jgi:hypothetical protein
MVQSPMKTAEDAEGAEDFGSLQVLLIFLVAVKHF